MKIDKQVIKESLLDDITAQKIAEDKIKIHSEEIEKMNQFMVDRELKIVELKEEIAQLKKQPKL